MSSELNLETKKFPVYEDILRSREVLKSFVGKILSINLILFLKL
jgi:hypothetical protein